MNFPYLWTYWLKCPTCHAPNGEPCFNLRQPGTGLRNLQPHKLRQRLVQRRKRTWATPIYRCYLWPSACWSALLSSWPRPETVGAQQLHLTSAKRNIFKSWSRPLTPPAHARIFVFSRKEQLQSGESNGTQDHVGIPGTQQQSSTDHPPGPLRQGNPDLDGEPRRRRPSPRNPEQVIQKSPRKGVSFYIKSSVQCRAWSIYCVLQWFSPIVRPQCTVHLIPSIVYSTRALIHSILNPFLVIILANLITFI